jgi:hypothetical protein
LPDLAEIVLVVDIDRGRRNPEREVFESLVKLPSVRRILGDFKEQLGLDPLTQVDQFAAAFTFQSSSEGPFAFVATLHPQAAPNLSGLRNRAKAQSTLFSEEHGKNFSYYSTRERSLVYWPDHRRLLFATGTWIEFVRKKAQAHPLTLANAHSEWATFWTDKNSVLRFAAHLPWSLRETLRSQNRGPAPASIMRMTGEFIWTHPMQIAVHLDLSNSLDARDLTHELESLRREAIKNSDLLYFGLGPHLESLRLTQEGARISLIFSPTATELGDFINGFVSRIQIP